MFAPLFRHPAVVLAVSGGPDSTALLLLMARWRRALKRGPKLLAVTIDHGLRRTSAAEARAVKVLARRLGVPHRTMRWGGKKPASDVYPNTPFENSVTGKPHPVSCYPNLPGDIYISAQLSPQTQAALVNNK